MKVEKVKVGIVGLGMVSYSHIKAYLSHRNSEVIAVCDVNEVHAKDVAKKYGIPKYYTSYDEMLKDPEINTVDITTPTFMHSQMTIAAAKAKKNIHCEKPFCLTLEDGLKACNAAKENEVALAVGESYVFMTSIMKARELIDAGEIGKPQQIRQRFGAWIEKGGVLEEREVVGDRGWRTDSAKAGGNGFPWMFDHCVHFFATAEYLMNDSRIKSVYSLTSDMSWMKDEQKHKGDNAKMDLYGSDLEEDIPIMTWTYDDPACQGVWVRASALNGKYDPMTGFSVSVIGDKGMIEVLGEGGGGLQWQGKSIHLVLHRKGKEALTFRFEEGGDDIWESEISYYSHAHINQIHRFVECLILGKKPLYSGLDGLRDVRSTMAAICSAKEGLPVEINEVTDTRLNK